MQMIQDTILGLRVEAMTVFQNLAVFPMLNGNGVGEPAYVTLDEALEQGSARVTEVSSAGNVPELEFVNDGQKPVLLLDGEELVGAKQNRVLNITLLAPAAQTIIIPVSCVEAGRWSHRSAVFASAGRVQYASGRAEKMKHVTASLQLEGTRSSRQSEVWADIDRKAERMQAKSETAAMSEMFERYSGTVEDYVNAFSVSAGQVGSVFAINGEMIGLELFDCPQTMRKLFPELLRSFALDAIDFQRPDPKQPSREEAQKFVEAVAKAECQQFPAVGIGEDVRFSSEGVVGGSLIADGRVVHLSAFAEPGRENDSESTSRSSMIRSSLRHQRRRT
ncbi:MAG: hypothetical protein AUJ92_20860 [Armatimonadetes bacterium CG2_30_59_28]|nr:hypothetical protein [Armatimonadota bacterium]OIO89665.1 MAG: hypothetical protein AUJ92_20860 [Armatimonadetes bacterium CG2_30_59_28]PIU61683.1 MAG: hypothetical protein COS85_20455 [Armatimonadetes bacterium CG07_land_8_20_14_0_80_59_28]PIX40044.1 MAG: hypothetical protein COZ56_15720 [Armatimonadetes bacterium CG_4_8_14_3_um_filter_58_9]